jgi:hypothetical protein
MRTVRTVSSFGQLPELHVFRCERCDEVVTIVESTASLVQVPVELGFI